MPCKMACLLHSSYGKVGPNQVSDDVQGEQLKRDVGHPWKFLSDVAERSTPVFVPKTRETHVSLCCTKELDQVSKADIR